MKLSYMLRCLYIAFAAYVWVDFTGINYDGLANGGLMLAVLPVTVVGLILGWLVGEERFVLLPDSFGYLGDHAVFYFPSACIVAVELWYLGRLIDRRHA